METNEKVMTNENKTMTNETETTTVELNNIIVDDNDTKDTTSETISNNQEDVVALDDEIKESEDSGVIEDNKEDEIETIPLDEVYSVCSEYLDGNISQKELQQWGQKVRFRPYIPIIEKTTILIQILFLKEQQEEDSVEWNVATFETNKFWYALLKYTNIETEGYEEYLNFASYDIIYPVIGDWIMSQCYTDYDRLIKMINDAVNIYNITGLLTLFEGISPEGATEALEKMQQQSEKLQSDKELIADLFKNAVK